MERRNFLKSAALGAAGAALAAPMVNARNAKTLTIVSSWPRDLPGVGLSAQRLARRITDVSNGAIRTEYFAAGERVGPFDVFDEVATGNSQAYIAADSYWIGKHPGFAYFTSVPFGMTSHEWNAWINFRGGQALWDRLSGDFGLKALACGTSGTQAGGWFNREIDGPEDLRGLKMRIPGLGGAVMSKLGVSTVSLPGGQIYENLVSGAVEAAEWIGPYNDYFMKFYEAARFYYTAGMHEPGGAQAFGVNASWWGGLSEYERDVITACCYEENTVASSEAAALNGEYLARLVSEHGVEARRFSDDVWDAFGAAAVEAFEETRDHSPLAAEINDAFRSAMVEVGAWLAVADVEFQNQRNRILGIGSSG